ncbi:MAG: cadherin repeat domain-containing protein, partial [Planctomycetes bacterium]|nr:cadherin repeat domain-containing protein [Planctomycetota bacterium]
MVPAWIRHIFTRSTSKPTNNRVRLSLETLEDRTLPSAVLPFDTATILLGNSAIDENQYAGALVGQFTQHLPGASGYTSFSLVSGAGSTDNGSFSIGGNQLRTTQKFNFEAQSTFSVRVHASATNGVTSDEVFTITVRDLNEAPSNPLLDNAKVNENSTGGTLVGVLSATDPDAGNSVTFTLPNSASGKFQINGNRLEVANNAALDFEKQKTLYVRVRATDGAGLWSEQGFTISLNNLNEAPDKLTLNGSTVRENSPTGTYVGWISTSDPDGPVPTLSLADDAGGRFKISGSNLVVNDGSLLDFETNASHQVTIRATDALGLQLDKTYTINVANVNEAPTDITLSNAFIAMPAAAGAVVGQLGGSDPDANSTLKFILTNNAGGKFQVSGNELKITNSNSFKYDPKPSYDISVMVQDQFGLTFQKTFTITVENAAQVPVNQPPTNIILSNDSVVENSPDGAYVAYVSAIDPDSFIAPTLSLVDDAGGRFRFDGTNLVVNDPKLIDFETDSSHQVTIRATDNLGLDFDKTFTIKILNQNEAPEDLSLSNDFIVLPAANGAEVGQLSASDPDAGTTFQYILTDNAGGKFQIVGDRLQITNSDSFKWDQQPTYDIHVMVLDQFGLNYEKTFTISVEHPVVVNTLGNQAPTDIVLSANSVVENSPDGSFVAYVSAVDADSFIAPTLSLVDDAGGRFRFDGSNLVVNDPSLIDFETNSSHQVTIRATDNLGLDFDKTFTINVVNQNEAPTDITLSNAFIALPAGPGAPVGILGASDPDAGTTFQFILTDNAGGKFQIVGNQLRITNADQFKWDAQPTYDIHVLVLDQFGLGFEKSFTITVDNAAQVPANQAPNQITLSGNTISENSPDGAYVAYVSSVDPDSYVAPTL